MRKLLTSFIFIFSAFFLQAQSKKEIQLAKLDWMEPREVLFPNQEPRKVLMCETCINLESDAGNPYVSLRVDGSHVATFKFEKVSTTALNDFELELIDTSKIGKSFSYRFDHTWERKNPISFIFIKAIRKNQFTGKYEKLVDFEYRTELLPISQVKSLQNQLRTTQETSVFAQGDWVKLKFVKGGVYKVSGANLQNLGIDIGSINPATLKIFGNGGGMLSRAPRDRDAVQPVENPIFLSHNGDNRFDESEYILFHVKDPFKWTQASFGFQHQTNLYSDSVAYFLTYGGENGKRIQSKPAISSEVNTPILKFNERWFHEPEQVSVAKTGRDWYGDVFDVNPQRTYNIDLTDIEPQTSINFNVSALGRAVNSLTHLQFHLNNIEVGQTGGYSFQPVSNGLYSDYGSVIRRNFSVNSTLIANGVNPLKISYLKNGNNGAIAYLDAITVNFQRRLNMTSEMLAFRSIESTQKSISTYSLGLFGNDVQIWDISHPGKISSFPYTTQNGRAIFSDTSLNLREYIALAGNNFPGPPTMGRMSNQDILNNPLPDLIIVTHPNFYTEAERLANFRRESSGMDVLLVTTNQVYNQFSAGVQDISAIRNLAAYYFNQAGGEKLKYLLLFGDCSYDPKYRIAGNTNFIPVDEAFGQRASLNALDSYASDDFFAILNYNKRDWDQEVNYVLDIGVGRLPVKTLEESRSVVNKLIQYSTGIDNLGAWRNNVTFLADDGDGHLHLSDADQCARIIERDYQNYNPAKIYIAAYPKVSLPGGDLSPSSRAELLSRINRGTLIFNYSGHGNEVQLTDEAVVDSDLYNNFTNDNANFFGITATCSFGKFDDPSRVSGAEQLTIMPRVGAIGMMTTGRAVFANNNLRINTAFYNKVFRERDGKMPLLGDVLRNAKNSTAKSGFIDNRGFVLLGDPSMMLAYPQEVVTLTKKNGEPIPTNSNELILNALEKIEFEGEIRATKDGPVSSNFNGALRTIIFDKPTELKTLISNNNRNATAFRVRRNIIYNGESEVKNGKFKFSFVVPKDISYLFGQGKISFYGRHGNILKDAGGFNTEFTIGGTNINAPIDTVAPTIDLFINDLSFKNGGYTHSNPILIARLFDESGINTSQVGIGHDMTATLDNDGSKVYILNEYFTTEQDSFQAGWVRFPFYNLSEGMHTVSVRGWDTYNNSKEARISFRVLNGNVVKVDDATIYPNPFSDKMFFKISHPLANKDVQLNLQIYNSLGQKVYAKDHIILNAPSTISDESNVYWNGRNTVSGEKVAYGMYFCRITLKSMENGSTDSQTVKILYQP